MATWADVVAKQNELIRKVLDAEVFLAPIATAVPTSIVAGGVPTLPSDFVGLGHHTDDGLRWGRETEVSEITSHGAVEPSRVDTRRVNRTLQVTAQETNRQTIEASLSVDLSAQASTSATGTSFDEPDRPKATYYRLLAIGVDDSDDGEIYIGRCFARAKLNELGEEVWSDGDDALVRDMTFGAFKDDTAGLSVRHMFGGPGWDAALTKMGFSAVTGT